MGRRKIEQAAAVILLLALLQNGALGQELPQNTRERQQEATAGTEAFVPETALYAGIAADLCVNGIAEIKKNKERLVAAPNIELHPEEKVYSFLQGPKSFEEGRAWSGAWSGEYVNGNYFGNFSCGLCCMANIYSTLTDYMCSPWDMFGYARQVSGYTPCKKTGAIGWADMKVTLRKSGFDCALCNKPGSYEEFQAQMAQAESAVVLVSSRDDDTYWERTGGHYVNIWLYNGQTDEVFLSDPGSPDRNRSFIPLRYVYDAMKTASQYQYLLVNSYADADNLWKHDGTESVWIRS